MAENENIEHDSKWAFSRIRRHVSAMMHLAWPAMFSRIGFILLGFVDTVLVGHYSTQELAYLNLGSSTLILLILVMSMGLFLGTLVQVADAFGHEAYKECGQVWKRAIPIAVGVGIFVMILFIPSEQILLSFGQSPELAREGGKIMYILGIGIIGHLFYINCAFFLEAVGRAKIAVYVLILVNVANVGISYVLIYGLFGFPEMGAEGSALATTILRFSMGVGLMAYLYFAPEFEKFGLREPLKAKWSEWKKQRQLGYSSSISLGAEVSAFSALSVFAGLIGSLELAIFGVIFNIISLPFMFGAGLGVATSVRVAISKSRNDADDTALAGWTGLILSFILVGFGSLFLIVFPEEILSLYSQDQLLISAAIAPVMLAGLAIIFDGGQTVLSSALRGLGETWGPMILQSISYILFMTPFSYWLSITLGRGVLGLVEGILIASILSCLLQGFWFHKKATLKG